MSLLRRAIRGSIANLASVGLQLVLQLISVPVLLSRWGEANYGLWIAINSLYTLLITLDVGHQNYVGGELSKQVPVNTAEAVATFRAGVLGELGLALLEVVVAFILLATGYLVSAAGVDVDSTTEVALSIGALLFAWASTGAAGGILIRLYQPHLEFERFAWLGVLYRTLLGFCPIVTAAMGGSVPTAALASSVVSIVGVIHVFLDVRKRYPAFSVSLQGVQVRDVWRNIVGSSVLTLTTFITQLQQHLLLLVMAEALGGLSAIPAFTTMRTVANVLLQAATTITAPIAPDMIRFHVTRNHEMLAHILRMLTLVGTYFTGIAVAVGIPFMPILYVWWTRGRTEFEAPLYALLAASVVVRVAGSGLTSFYAGINALRAQFFIASAQAIVTIGGAWLVVPRAGMRGAGLIILIAELIGSLVVPNVMLFATQQDLATKMGVRGLITAWMPALAFVPVMICAAYGFLQPPEVLVVGLVVLLVLAWPSWRALPLSIRTRLSQGIRPTM